MENKLEKIKKLKRIIELTWFASLIDFISYSVVRWKLWYFVTLNIWAIAFAIIWICLEEIIRILNTIER